MTSEVTLNTSLQLKGNEENMAELIQLIGKADRFLLLNFYAVDCDPHNAPLFAALQKKANSGTDVRLVTNQKHSWLTSACVKSLESFGIKVAKGSTPASYIVNDKGDLAIGSQNLWGPFALESLLFLNGPLATDAIRHFARAWEAYRDDEQLGIEGFISDIKTNLTAEYANHLRKAKSLEEFRELPKTSLSGLCQWVSGDYRRVLEGLLPLTYQQVIWSGSFTESEGPIATDLVEKSNRGLKISYWGNSFSSGHGYYSKLLEDKISQLNKSSYDFLSPVLDAIKSWDMSRTWKKNQLNYDRLKDESKVKVYTASQYVNSKLWLFDQSAVFIGSANFSGEDLNQREQAGVLCFDPALAQQAEIYLTKKIQSAIPY